MGTVKGGPSVLYKLNISIISIIIEDHAGSHFGRYPKIII